MQENYSFEYAIIRVVPKVEREEFLNAGVILYCPQFKFLNCLIKLDEKKLELMCCNTDIDEVKRNLDALEGICKGTATGSPIAKLDIASRFRWLTATRSTIVQSSKVHPGLCDDPDDKLNKLFNKMVL